jgi:hypothetical protein
VIIVRHMLNRSPPQINVVTNVFVMLICSPLNCDAGNMVRAGDDAAFKSMARMYCVEYALGNSEFKREINW